MPPGKQFDPNQSGPTLDLDPIQEAEREERRVYRDAVDAGSNIGKAVEIVLRRGSAPALEVHRLGSPDEATAPEIHPGDLGQKITHGCGIAPLDRIPIEYDASERRARTAAAGIRQDGEAHCFLLLRLKVAGSVVDGI